MNPRRANRIIALAKEARTNRDKGTSYCLLCEVRKEFEPGGTFAASGYAIKTIYLYARSVLYEISDGRYGRRKPDAPAWLTEALLRHTKRRHYVHG